MAEVNGARRTAETEESVVAVKANNHVSGNTFYLEPGEELEICDDAPNRVVITTVEGSE